MCLQRQNTSLKRELDSHRLKSHLTSQVREQMQQPYSYVVDAVRQREAQIRACRRPSPRLETVSSLREDQAALQQGKTSMAAGLQRLLLLLLSSKEEELAVMMEVVLSMRTKDGGTGNSLESNMNCTGISSAG